MQYKDFVWTYLDYDRYRIYSYQGGTEIAKYISYTLSKQMAVLEKRLDYQIEDKINVLVYNNQQDFKQSNLGLSSDEQSNIGGVTRIIGDKINVFFNGSHAELDQQLRLALAELMLNKIMYGGNAREMIRNSTLLFIPEWYTQGLVKYLAEGWSTTHDNVLYDAIKNNDFNKFNRLTGKQAANAGHALWYYIVSTFGESMIPNILYMTKVTRSLDHAFLASIGVTQDNLVYDFAESYERRIFMFRDSLRKSPVDNQRVLKRFRANRHYYQVKVSPDGEQVLYARNELNQLRVYLKSLKEKSPERLLKLGPKLEQLEDFNYPLLAWHPNGKLVSMIYPFEDELILQTNNLEDGQVVKRSLPGFEKVNSMSYSDDGKKLALSAVKRGKGQSDIFVFTVNTSGIEQLTNDIWDDNNAVFVKNSKQIVFESNRMSDTVKAGDDARYFVKLNRNMDLFMAAYPFTNKVLVRVSNTPEVNETQAQAYKSGYITYLSDKNGIYNRYLAEFDSSIAYVDTTEHYRFYFKSRPVGNSDRHILEQHISKDGLFIAERVLYKGKDLLLVNPLPDLTLIKTKDPINTWYRGYVSPAVTDPSEYRDVALNESVTAAKSNEPENKGIDFDHYRFEGEADKSQAGKTGGVTKADSARKAGSRQFQFPLPRNYYTSFYTDYLVTQFDNSFLANNYQVFSGGGSPIYMNPGANFLSKIAISDLFEDQRITGGFRINPNLDNEFMLSWEQRKGRVDKQLLLDRQTFATVVSVNDAGAEYNAKINTHTIKYTLKYPFSPVASVRGSILYRNDRKVALSLGDVTLPQKNQYENMAGLRAEYVFDNTRKVMLNILNGFRFKVWTEYWQYADSKGNNLFTSGFDARHYLKVHRQITWCNRLAGGNSLGSKRLLFYLGGVDNWLNPSFNANVNIASPGEYGFQTLATNMRGFKQNIRNGNNFVVYNSELRIPVVKYLINYSLKSDFLNNLQMIGFADVGMAWHGANPLSEENTENSTVYVDNDPVTGKGSTGIIIKMIDYKNPLVGGVGFGVRSRLLGYFVRLDFGWGIDNWQVQKRVVGLSLSTDF